MTQIIHSFENNFTPLLIQENISLKTKNWFNTGGAARFYSEPVNAEQFQEAIRWANKHSLPIYLLGEGANILISDAGVNGLVIRPQIHHINFHDINASQSLVTAGAGVSFGKLIKSCLERNLLGLHEFSGIPGTVGGSVFINIHYFEFLLSNFLVNATVIHAMTGDIISVNKEWFNFGYNQSKLHNRDYYLLDATFALNQGSAQETAYAQGRHDEMIRYRSRRYPTAGTCGSFFRNFFEHEIAATNSGKKLIYVAYYLDKLGIKGELFVGDAHVSHQHANMIVNRGNATSHDIVTLARTMQEKVATAFNLVPQAECQFLGFDNYPLHT